MNIMMRLLTFLILIALMGCGTTIHTVAINPVQIEFVEHRTFWSTTAVAIVHKDGQVVGVASGTGKPIAGLAADLTSTAVMGAAIGFVGLHLKDVNTGTSQVNVSDITGGGP